MRCGNFVADMFIMLLRRCNVLVVLVLNLTQAATFNLFMVARALVPLGGMPPSLLLFLFLPNHPSSKREKIWVDENIYRPIWVTCSHYCGLKAISLMSNGGAVSVLWTFLHFFHLSCSIEAVLPCWWRLLVLYAAWKKNPQTLLRVGKLCPPTLHVFGVYKKICICSSS